MDATKKPSVVPKFASFKKQRDNTPNPTPPEPQSEPQPEPQPSKEQTRRDSHRDREKGSHGKHRSRHDKDKPHHHHRHHHDRPQTRSASPERRTPKPTRGPQEDPLYVVDKRGDHMIARYGCNERSKVPSYRRYGAGKMIGADGRIRLIYEGSKELFSLGNRPGEGPSVFHDRALMSKAARKKTRVFRLRAEPEQKQAHTLADEPDFLPLSEPRKPRDAKEEIYEVSGDEDAPNYRSIQGKAKARDFVDSDLESADTSDSDADADLDASNPIKQRSIELSRQIKDHPDDIGAWLELVDMQESLLRLDEHVRPNRTSDEVKGLASISLALLEEALPHATKEADKEKVFLRLMREGAKVWSSKVLSMRWADANAKTSSFALWKAHLDHELCTMTTFSYPALKQLHVERLQHLQQRLAETMSGLGGSSNQDFGTLLSICDEMAYVFLRLTCFIRDTGYTELAIAAWQTILELTFARPVDEPETTHAETVSSFKDFWESEVPRIGEDGAKGWRHFTEAEEMADLPDAKTEAASAVPETKDVYKAWAAVETQRSLNAALPARTLDEGTEEDPFRVTMFADLEPFLFYLPSIVAAMPKVKAGIVHGFLLFCQLPTPSIDAGDVIQTASLDPFVYRVSARLAERQAVKRSDTEDGSRKPPRFSDLGHRFVGSADVAFSGSNWFQLFNHEPTPATDLALAATTQLATMFGYGPIAEHSLGLSWAKKPSAIKKAAKALLKKWPNDTRLYHAYAIAEWRNGNQDVARHVLTSAVGQDLDDKARLSATWAWLELEAGNMKAALSRCIAVTGTSSADTESHATYAELLRARQNLSSSREFLLSAGNIHEAAVFAESSALLEYLSPLAGSTDPTARQGDIEAAMTSIQAFTTEAVSRGHAASPPLERLLQFAAHLLYLHATSGPFRPPYIRERLHTFATLFPSNTLFLALLAWAADTTTLLLTDPVRTHLRAHALTAPHARLTTRLFAIQHEMHASGGGTAHSVRTAFERALTNDRDAAASAGLWLSYVRLCGLHGRKELGREKKAKAKDVYYRALNACPWDKELAMEAFGPALLRDMESGELRAVWNTMGAKGLRLCVDLDEFGAEWARRAGGRA